MTRQSQVTGRNERGMALITALLATSMLLALGMAIVFSATVDTVTTKSARLGEQAFFVADAGIGIARRALSQALFEEIDKVRTGAASFYRNNPPAAQGQFPDVQIIPDPDGTDSASIAFYQRVYARANQLCRDSARDQRLSDLNGSSYSVSFNPLSGNVSLVTTDASHATEVIVFRYGIKVTGKTAAGGQAAVNETGRLSANIVLQTTAATQGYRDFSFSGFGAFFDVGDSGGMTALSPGTYSGAVHTNTHFAFYSPWNYTFRNAVTQYDAKIRYFKDSGTVNNMINIPTGNITGISLSSDGYKKVDAPLPMPTNAFSQEYAVINGTGVTDKNSDGTPVDPPAVIPTDNKGKPVAVFDSNGRVNADVLAANLRDPANSNNPPKIKGQSLDTGIYVASSDGNKLDGAGIYVQGDANDIQIYADTNGDQVYVIQQGTGGSAVTATVRVSYANSTTTVKVGNTTRTYTGLPMDKQDPTSPRVGGTMLFVNGNIKSLRGGKDSSNNLPAIASNTALTVTATRSIYVTGDLKYADPVVNSDGTPVANIKNIKNVLGLFTNDGNIFLDAKSSYVSGPGLSLEMDGAMCVFNSNTSNDNQSSTGVEGGITSYTGSGHQKPGSSDRIRMVGSDVEKNNSLVDYNYGDTYFDVRFSGGKFRPPFFPGTTYTLGTAPVAGVVTIAAIDAPASTAMSWFRDNN